MGKKATINLPPIPDKKYFTIGEVGKLCHLKPHVLRYWEQEFKILSPVKRSGSRRYYQSKDIEMVRNIRYLLYDKGFTIQGARKALGKNRAEEELADRSDQTKQPEVISELIAELEGLLGTLKEA